MAQITNTYVLNRCPIVDLGFIACALFSLNSVDSTSMVVSTTPSDDDDDADDHHQFLIPSSGLSSVPVTTITNGVVPSHTVIEMNPNENDSTMLDEASFAIQPLLNITTSTSPLLHPYAHRSVSSSDTSLAQPLLTKKHQTSPDDPLDLNREDERISSSSSSSSTSSSSTSSSIIPNCRSHMTLYFTDMLISAFIITPFVNIHWRGAWDLLDIHLLPNYPATSALISSGIGLFMLYVMYLTQGYLQAFYERHRHNIMGQVMTRLYTLLLALAYINQWRGLWNLLDLTSNTWYHLLGETVICVTFLLLMKSVYNLNSAPFLVGVDTESYFLLDSKHHVSVSSPRR